MDGTGSDRHPLLLVSPVAFGILGALAAAVSVEAEGDCPSRAAVEAALLPLARTSSAGSDAVSVVIRDRGPAYQVVLGGLVREVDDQERRCADRAQAAAVIAMLALAPPSIPESPDDTSPADAAHPAEARVEASEVRAEAPPPLPSDRTGIDLEADFATGLANAGAALRGAVLHGLLGLSGGLRATSASSRDVGFGGSARIRRSAADAGVRVESGLRPIDVAADLGLVLTMLSIEGVNLPVTRGATRFEPGLRGALSVRAWILDGVAVVVGGEACFTPWPTPIVIDPVSKVGDTGAFSFFATGGVLVRID